MPPGPSETAAGGVGAPAVAEGDGLGAPSGPVDRTATLRLSARSLVLAVTMFGLTLVVLRLLAASGRVLGWVTAAAVVAGLLHPAVEALARRMPRGAAVAVVALSTLALAGLVVYEVVDDVTDQLRELQREAPEAAAELERDGPFEDALQEFELADRVEGFVDELPERLRGGNVEDALRSAATRGLAFLATGVLSLFFLIHGRRLLAGAARQLTDGSRALAERVGPAVYRRSWNYLAGSIGMALLAGLLAYAVAGVVDVPGRAPLALWMALFDLVPLLGVVVGAAPLVLLAGARSPAEGLVVALVLVGYQLLEALWLQRAVERRSVHVGPFVTVVVGMIGLELYGIGGALVGFVVATLAAATLVELVPARALASGPLPSRGDGVLDRQG